MKESQLISEVAANYHKAIEDGHSVNETLESLTLFVVRKVMEEYKFTQQDMDRMLGKFKARGSELEQAYGKLATVEGALDKVRTEFSLMAVRNSALQDALVAKIAIVKTCEHTIGETNATDD